MQRRVVSLWFPKLASDCALRQQPLPDTASAGTDPAFALIHRDGNSDRLYCLNAAAEAVGLARGMTLSDARALWPEVITRPATPQRDRQFLQALARWAGRYCPWVGLDGADGLVLDISGSAHLFGGEAAMAQDMQHRLHRAGLAARIGLADTRGAAWALAHFAPQTHAAAAPAIAISGDTAAALHPLPVAALRLEAATCVALERLGLRQIGDLCQTPRAPLNRRFGPAVLMRLDQAMGQQGEPLTPVSETPRYALRLTLPDPIGLSADVMAGLGRLLQGLCDRLRARDVGARVLQLTLRRVDQASQQVDLRLARPMNDPAHILPLFERGISAVEAGYGIDQLHLAALQVEPLPPTQIQSGQIQSGHTHSGQVQNNRAHTGAQQAEEDALAALITRLGTRIGLENVQRFLPADSHIPERAYSLAAAAFSTAAPHWPAPPPRPLRLFRPEPVAGLGREPPSRFRWRGMQLERGTCTGPERLTPEWWLPSDDWHSGVRDYWQVETRQGRRLWMYHTPQTPGWFVQGEFA